MEKLKPRNNSVKQQIPLKSRTSFENENLLGNDQPEQVLLQHSKPKRKKNKTFLRLFLHMF